MTQTQNSIIRSSGEVSLSVARAAKLHRNRAEVLLGEIGLHVGQEMLLDVLWNEGELTQSELAERLEIQPATLTVALKRLEKAGLVVRSRDPQDQRVSLVQPAYRSVSLQPGVRKAWTRLEKETVGGLGAEEQAVLVRLLNKVSENLSS